jgi:murein DD-endopeptidase MepM/ murein hydrolase activator NlpD
MLTSGFGMRWGRMHEGIDIAAPTGTPIRAADSGSVEIAGYEGGYGNYTCIEHGGGLATCYAHQNSIGVSVGQTVAQAQIIGTVGSTGHSTGPHLHFEVRVNGQAVDPLGYL